MHEVEGFTVSTDPASLDLDWIHRSLSTDTYWATGRSKERVAQSLEHSIAYGLYDPDGRQVGVARLVTDRIAFAWLGDVYIDRSVRGRGLSKFLLERIMADVEAMRLRRIVLSTDDADGLYRQFEFTDLDTEDTIWLHRRWKDH